MLLTLVAFILILGLLVLVHELGHFLSAKIFGVKVEEFGFGLPPRLIGVYKTETGKRKIIWSKKISASEKTDALPRTIYSLNFIPVGGFVKIKGENGEGKNESDSLGYKKIWQRMMIMGAGVFLNVALCTLLLAAGFMFGIPSLLDDSALQNAKSVKDEKIQIISVNKNSPAEEVGLKIGDEILSINELPVKSVEFLQNFTNDNNGRLMDLKILRNNESIIYRITPEILPTSNGRAVFGMGLAKTGIISYPWYNALWQGIKTTGYLFLAMVSALVDLLKNIIMRGQVTAELAGPVGIAVLTGQVVNMGFSYVLQFAALLSLNLALINVLPLPALDGGRLLFLIIERIRHKEMNQKIEALVHNIGFALLMILIALVTYHDITRWGGKIIEKIF